MSDIQAETIAFDAMWAEVAESDILGNWDDDDILDYRPDSDGWDYYPEEPEWDD